MGENEDDKKCVDAPAAFPSILFLPVFYIIIIYDYDINKANMPR